jgi:hypothetical protein
MSGSPASVFGFAVIFLIVGALGGGQLGMLASAIFLIASAALFAFGTVTLVIGLRRLKADRAAEPAAPVRVPEPVA